MTSFGEFVNRIRYPDLPKWMFTKKIKSVRLKTPLESLPITVSGICGGSSKHTVTRAMGIRYIFGDDRIIVAKGAGYRCPVCQIEVTSDRVDAEFHAIVRGLVQRDGTNDERLAITSVMEQEQEKFAKIGSYTD